MARKRLFRSLEKASSTKGNTSCKDQRRSFQAADENNILYTPPLLRGKSYGHYRLADRSGDEWLQRKHKSRLEYQEAKSRGSVPVEAMTKPAVREPTEGVWVLFQRIRCRGSIVYVVSSCVALFSTGSLWISRVVAADKSDCNAGCLK
jgi:hypothetical protein